MSETCTVQRKTKVFPFFTNSDKTTTTTTTSRKEKINLHDMDAHHDGDADYFSDDAVCLRRKNVAFGFAESISGRPFSLRDTNSSANNEHIDNIKRLSSITQAKSSVVGFGNVRHNLWYETVNYTHNNSFIHNSKSQIYNNVNTLSGHTNYYSDNEKSSESSPFKRGNSFRQSWNNLWRKRKGKSRDLNNKIEEIETINTIKDIVTESDDKMTKDNGDSAVTKCDLSKFDLFEPLDIATAHEVLKNDKLKLGHRRVHSYSGCTNYR